MMLPNFLFVGPDKSGSTWLYFVLRDHPQIFVPTVKDLEFFDQYYERGLSWYAGYFADAKPQQLVRAELSHDYLYSMEALDRIARDLPGVRVMITLREPVDRAFSAYLMMRKLGIAKLPFREVLADREFEGLIERGRYTRYVQACFDRFGRENTYLALYDDLTESSAGFAAGVYSYLGLREHYVAEDLLMPVLQAGQARLPAVNYLLKNTGSAMKAMGLTQIVWNVKQSSMVQKLLYRNYDRSDRPMLSLADEAHARAIFRDDVVRLSGMCGIDVAKRWGYR